METKARKTQSINNINKSQKWFRKTSHKPVETGLIYIKNHLVSFVIIILIVTGFNACTNVNADENSSGQEKAAMISVSDYGAIPDDGKDDTRAIIEALSKCKIDGTKRLIFEGGQYDFYPTFAGERYCFISNNDEGLKRIAFDLKDISDLTIDGRGSQMMFHGFISPFIAEGSENIKFENFSIDFSRTFHSESIILGYNKESMDVEIREGFPFKVHNQTLLFTEGKKEEGILTSVSGRKGLTFGSSHMLEYDTEKRETAYMVKDYYFSNINGFPAKKLGGRKVRILVPGLTGTIGNTMVFGPNHREHPGFVLTDSKDIVFEKVTIHHAGGMGIIGQRTHNITVNFCKVTPSAGRMISTTADATHFVNCTGKIALTNNLFENQKDDATNIHGIYVKVVEKTAENKVIVQIKHHQQHGFDFLRPGMEVEFVRAKSMVTYDTATVKEVNKINKEVTEVTFTDNISVNFELGDAIAEIRNYPEILIADNIIRNNRARGMLLNCRGKTVVENNTFHSPGAAILFEGDSFFWFEQGGVRDCVIRNNTFNNCLYGVWGKAIVDVKAGIREDKETSRYNRNILIENNTFRMYDELTLLNAYCVDGLTWQNNTVEMTNAYPQTGESNKRFVVNYSDNVKIDDEEYRVN